MNVDNQLEHGPPTDKLDSHLVQAILGVATHGDAGQLTAMLQINPTLVAAKDQYAKTPLHLAAEHNHAEIAALLLAAGAEVEALTCWGMTPLEWAANMGSRAVAEKLLAKGARLNMWSAAGLGMLDVVKTYWEGESFRKVGAAQTRCRQDEGGTWVPEHPFDDEHEIISDAFYIASRNGHTDVAAFLLAKGADINFRGFFGAPGLHWAAINGHAETVKFLLAHGADRHIRDTQFNSDAQGWANEGGRSALVDLLA